jgi:hypothetical protein
VRGREIADTATASSITTIKATRVLFCRNGAPVRSDEAIHPLAGPALGAHTDAVFLDMLRLDVEEIERVWKQGAI